MDSLRAKSLLLTGYMEYLLELRVSPREFIVMTPRDPRFRGCQLSLIFPQEGRMMEVFRALEAAGIICDERKPDCIRLAPVPLYNTFTEVWTLVDTLRTILGPEDQ
jgi:kynureninase